MTTNRNCKNEVEYIDHVHEIIGSTSLAEERRAEPHNHRYATMSSLAIRCGDSHVHDVEFTTDTHEDHEHDFCGRTGTAVFVGQGRHTHFLQGRTTTEDGHSHPFRVNTLIENPIRRSVTRDEERNDDRDTRNRRRY